MKKSPISNMRGDLMKTNIKLVKHTFIDGDFSMEVGVSEEERTIYMSQKEMVKIFEISQGTISKFIKEIHQSQMGQYSSDMQIVNMIFQNRTSFYSLETIKEIGQKYNPDRLEKLENWLYDLFPENDIDIIDGDYEIVRYNQDNLNIPVRIDKTTNSLWMTQNEIADLFETTRQDISHHIQNLFEDKEIETEGMRKYYLHMLSNGRRYETTIYSIDVILIIGYRVRTRNAINFRRWANEALKNYLSLNYYAATGKNVNHLEEANIRLANRIESHEERIDKIEQEIDSLKPKYTIFYRNESFNAYMFLSMIMANADKEIFIIDPYADKFILSVMSAVKDNIKIFIVLDKLDSIDETQKEIFHRSHPNTNITLIKSVNEHDRYIFIDSKYGYDLGQSFNTLGYYNTVINKIDDAAFVKTIIKKYKDE